MASGHDAIGIAADIVTDRSTVRRAVRSGHQKYGKIDCLFDNAGVVVAAA